MTQSLKYHWEKIYQTKNSNEVSWTQQKPDISLEFIHKNHIDKSACIIDVGGGDSKLVDCLLEEEFTNLTVLDISEEAVQKAKQRLGALASKVNWIVCDVLEFKPAFKYDVWHDRAAFHFQTDPEKIEQYLSLVKKAVKGLVIVGTFSVDGPNKCSGLEVRQYDEASMKDRFEQASFSNVECKREDHITPSGAVQNFVFCSFLKLDSQLHNGLLQI